MSRQIDLDLKDRELTTNGDLNKSRKVGIIPCVIYGKGSDPINASVDKKYFMGLVLHSLDEHIIFNVSLGGKKKKFLVIMKDRQWDPIKQEIIHIDFKKIDLKEEIEMYSEFRFNGTPKGVKQGGVIEVRHTKVKGICLPADYPKYLDCDISSLGIGDYLRMKDIAIPEGLKVYFSPEEIILTIAVPKAARGDSKEMAQKQQQSAAVEGADKSEDK